MGTPDGGSPDVPLVASKLVAPELPTGVVARPRLTGVVHHTEIQVVVVVAPPGYGKTVVARQWADAAHDHCVAWLSVDALDENTELFWHHLIGAVRRALPDLDHEPEALLREHGPDSGLFLAALSRSIGRSGRALLVVIDDLHLVRDQATLRLLATLVDQTHGSARYLFTGRTDPLLPTPRWRAAGRAEVLRADDLRFLPPESTAYFGAAGLDGLSAQETDRLIERTNGWIAGMQLMALSVQGRGALATDTFEAAAADRMLVDYVVQEVLAVLDEPRRDAVLALSVLDPIDPRVAAVLLDDPAARATLRALVDAGVFLSRLGTPDEAFRFHPLVRDLLERELREQDPVRHAGLHEAAAGAYEAFGDVDRAYLHLLAAGKDDAALDLVLRPMMQTIDAGAVGKVSGWLDRIPTHVVVRDPERLLDLAFAQFVTDRFEAALLSCRRCEEVAPGGRLDPPARSRLEVQRSVIDLAGGDTAAALERLYRLRDDPTASSGYSDLEQRRTLFEIRALLLAGDLGRARLALRSADPGDAPVPTAVTLEGLRAWLALEEGEVDAARQQARSAVATAERYGARPHHGTFDTMMVLARACVVAGDFDEAREVAEALALDAAALRMPWHRVLSGVVTAQATELADPFGALARLQGVAEESAGRVHGALAELLWATIARALLRCGSRAEAARIAATLPAGVARALLEARLALADQAPRAVEAALGDTSTWPLAARVEALVLQALAEPAARGAESLRAALDLARPAGIVRPFLGEGNRLADLLGTIDDAAPGPAAATDRAGGASSEAPQRLVEPLTQRELEILALLPTHLTYGEIAKHNFVSTNTVKTHVQAIYRKLGVSSRSAAVAAATALGVLGT